MVGDKIEYASKCEIECRHSTYMTVYLTDMLIITSV
jgi:hypothetical protein